MIGVPRTPVVAQPAGSPHGGASPTAAAGYPAATTTTTATYTVPVAVPVSTQAAPIATRAL